MPRTNKYQIRYYYLLLIIVSLILITVGKIIQRAFIGMKKNKRSEDSPEKPFLI